METNLTPDRTVPARINVNRITARLSDVTFEERFLDWRREHDLRRIRLVAVLSFPVSAIFAVLDWQVISENLDLALAIRAGMCVIGASVAYAMTLVDFFRRRLNLINWLIIGFTTLCYAVLNSVSDTPDEYLSGYILVLMFLYFLLPAGYLMSVAIGITCTIVFAVLIPLTRAIESGQLLTIYSQYVVTIVAGSFAVYQINVLRRHEFLNELQIAHQNRQYFDLLTRILPRSIVERMENGEKQIADSVPEAVVLFADVVSFTEMAAQNRPEVVVTTLNRLFEKFDACVAAHRLEKIKTIGDAYMVAGGIPEPREDYITATADLALDMLEAATGCTGPDGAPIAVRIGIHAGPVLAGVIGDSRVGYDLWGDTVNVASRLQESAEPGSIRIAGAVQSGLANDYTLRPLGPVALKGKGSMPTWELIDRRHK